MSIYGYSLSMVTEYSTFVIKILNFQIILIKELIIDLELLYYVLLGLRKGKMYFQKDVFPVIKIN